MIRVWDDVLPDPDGYRAAMLQLDFKDVETSPGVVFHNLAPVPDSKLVAWISRHYGGLTPMLTFVRKSPRGQVEPNFVHTDRDMGDVTGILYLNPVPARGDGTTFWKHKATGKTESDVPPGTALVEEWLAWRDRSQWEPWCTVPAQFNRLILFSAGHFHSRAIEENYGEGDEARLIQVVFGTGTLE